MLKTMIASVTVTGLLLGTASYNLYQKQAAALRTAQAELATLVTSSDAVVGACHALEKTVAAVNADPAVAPAFATEGDYGKALALEAESLARQKFAAAQPKAPRS